MSEFMAGYLMGIFWAFVAALPWLYEGWLSMRKKARETQRKP